MGNGRGGPTGTETEMERRRGRRAGARRKTGIRSEKESVGGERGGVMRSLRGRECRLVSAHIISRTSATEEWSWHFGEWPRPTWTWEYSRKPSARTESTPTCWLGTASLLRTRRADTVAEYPCSTSRRHILQWRPYVSLAPTLLASSWRRERGGCTSLDFTSPPTTPRR